MADEISNARRVGSPIRLLQLENSFPLQHIENQGSLGIERDQILLVQLPKAKRPRFLSVEFDSKFDIVKLKPELKEFQFLRSSPQLLKEIVGLAGMNAASARKLRRVCRSGRPG